MSDIDKILDNLTDTGFGNQAIIVGTKRVHLKDWLKQEINALEKRLREEERNKIIEEYGNDVGQYREYKTLKEIIEES